MKKLIIFALSIFLISCMNNSNLQNSTNSASESQNQEVQNTENKIFVDVRTPEEWAEWHVKNAIHIPLADIQNGLNIDKIPKDVPVYVYCRSGNRSGQAIKILSENYGFTNLQNAGWMKDLIDVEIVK